MQRLRSLKFRATFEYPRISRIVEISWRNLEKSQEFVLTFEHLKLHNHAFKSIIVDCSFVARGS